MQVFFSNLGCKLNQAETESLKRQFVAAGHQLAASPGHADLHVVNSCTVTHVAARDSRKILRRGKRLNPQLRTVLTGCYVGPSADDITTLDGIDLVVPNHLKEDLLARVGSAFPEWTQTRSVATADVPYLPMELVNTRTLVKIEDGCNMPCAFCVIPQTRGRQRSRPLGEVADEVRALEAAGFREVVITGVQISSYRQPGHGLFELVETLLEQTESCRLRLTSIAPWQFDRRLLDLLGDGRVCRHVHLSLQSGCDGVLERMRRPYTTEKFASLVGYIRERIPGIAITTDVIVGFPGETEEDFEASLDFTEAMDFARIHAFPYSPRPGTTAAAMNGQISPQVKRQRMSRLLALAERAERTFWRCQLGADVEVLWERPSPEGWVGMSDNYIRVVTREVRKPNQLDLARLAAIGVGGVEVDIVDARAEDRKPSYLASCPLPT